MITYYAIFALVLGLVVGSFLNVIIYRMDDLRSVIFGRSNCPDCKTNLKWYDLVPVLSFVLLKAKCRYCSRPISFQYPIVEICTGLLFSFLYLMFGISWGAVFYALIFSIMIVVVAYDIKTQTVPEIFVWIALGLAVIFGWYFGAFPFMNAIYGILIGGGFLAILVLISKERWMGAGDIKIGALMGALVGYPQVFLGLFSAFVLGSVIGIIIILAKRGTIKARIAFAPFMVLATLFTIVYGGQIINWYLTGFNTGFSIK